MHLKADHQVICWLLEGDVSIRYQVWRDLFDQERPDLQMAIASEGWGSDLLSRRGEDYHWGGGFCHQSWRCSHYALLDLCHMALSPSNKPAHESIEHILKTEKQEDGGIGPSGETHASDVCINGMFLNYACYFGVEERRLQSIVDFLIREQMVDGGFNCRSNRKGARHSSFHSTISVLEGFLRYQKCGYQYRVDELSALAGQGQNFLLLHALFRSDRTGQIIHSDFLKLPYPWRWKYNILRALDYLRNIDMAFDPAIEEALDRILVRRRKDGCWPTNAKHRGESYIVMDKAGEAGRWNSLIALRVLRHFDRLPEDLRR